MSGTIIAPRSGSHATAATTTPVDQSARPAAEAAETLVDEAVGTLVVAFAADPVIRWLLPDGARCVAHFPRLLGLVGDVASSTGAVDAVGGVAGAAPWIASGTQLPEEEFADLLQQSVEAARQEDAFALLEQMDLHHPPEPHWYLPFIGVDPLHQGRGYGSALLRTSLGRCDREHASRRTWRRARHATVRCTNGTASRWSRRSASRTALRSGRWCDRPADRCHQGRPTTNDASRGAGR